MENNDIIRRLRFIFDFNDDQMIKIFSLAQLEVTREQVCNWLKKPDEPDVVLMNDKLLATFFSSGHIFQHLLQKVIRIHFGNMVSF